MQQCDASPCAFDAPEVDERSGEGQLFRVATPLPVSMARPVGARYEWRVRACNGAECSGWSDARVLHVGRLPDDMDGDGYSELFVGGRGRGRYGGGARGRLYLPGGC